MTTRTVRKRLKPRLETLWRDLNECKSIWPTEKTYKDAVDLYYTKSNDLFYKFKACIMLVCDMADETDKLLPELVYLTMVYKHRIRSAKQLMMRIIKENVPVHPEVFPELCWHLFDTKVECINVCPKEV